MMYEKTPSIDRIPTGEPALLDAPPLILPVGPSPSWLRQDLGLLTEEELAAALDVRLSTLAGWRSRKEGPVFTRLGKRVFYRLDDVIEWIASQRSTVTQEVTA